MSCEKSSFVLIGDSARKQTISPLEICSCFCVATEINREELLNETMFRDMTHARITIQSGATDYN
jgi:hypothetical protein